MKRKLTQLPSPLLLLMSFAALCLGATVAQAADFGPQFKVRTIPVDGSTIHVTVGGNGPPVLLLHGYAETSRMWQSLAAVLAPRLTVIAPDLPGIGDSSIPKSGIDMTTSAKRIHEAVRALGYTKVRVVGHDIGLMVAYAYAALYPQEVEKLVLMDAFLPGVDGWEPVYNSPGIWHFRFFGPVNDRMCGHAKARCTSCCFHAPCPPDISSRSKSACGWPRQWDRCPRCR